MPDLYITQALPNPPGKDRPPQGGPSNTQLNFEWIEFANAAGRTIDLGGLQILHQTFNWRCERTGEQFLMAFQGPLQAGQSIRIHTGQGVETWEGSVLHLYLGRSNYVWNNVCGDTAQLKVPSGMVDWAWYAPNPSQGSVLRRVPGTNQLR